MAVSLTTITGSVEFPSGATPARAIVRFTLTDRGQNGSNIFLGMSEFPVASSGAFTAEVQHTDTMDEWVYYEVSLSYLDQSIARQVDRKLGLIKVPESGGSVVLSNLLPITIPSNASSVHRVTRGDTISFGIQMLDHHNRPLDLTGYGISASMRQGDSQHRSFAVTRVPPAVVAAVARAMGSRRSRVFIRVLVSPSARTSRPC